MTTDIRHLARVVTIDGVHPAHNADRLEIASVGGWQVVVRRGEYSPGDRAVFTEIDAAVPVEDARFGITGPMAEQATTVDGESRFVIRSVSLRGNLSQGMLFDITAFPDLADTPVGTDVTAALGIVKFQAELPDDSSFIGDFPSRFARKSDAERIQNLTDLWPDLVTRDWLATEKLDGTSVTLVNDGGRVRVAGRNFEVVPVGQPIWDAVDVTEFLGATSDGDAVQGELVGPKIGGNRLGLDQPRFAVFAVYRQGRPVPRPDWPAWATDRSVPVLDEAFADLVSTGHTPEEVIAAVDGLMSSVSPGHRAEGVVFHSADAATVTGLQRPNFKVISNSYLLKGGTGRGGRSRRHQIGRAHV